MESIHIGRSYHESISQEHYSNLYEVIFLKEIYPVKVSVVDLDDRKCVVICTLPISSPIPTTSPSCLLSPDC